MRISDWSSDVCSSDLAEQAHNPPAKKVGYFPCIEIAMGIFTACPNSHVPVVAPTTPTTFEVGTAGLLQSFGGSSGLKQRRRGLFWSLPAFQKPGSLKRDRKSTRLNSSH